MHHDKHDISLHRDSSSIEVASYQLICTIYPIFKARRRYPTLFSTRYKTPEIHSPGCVRWLGVTSRHLGDGVSCLQMLPYAYTPGHGDNVRRALYIITLKYNARLNRPFRWRSATQARLWLTSFEGELRLPNTLRTRLSALRDRARWLAGRESPLWQAHSRASSL